MNKKISLRILIAALLTGAFLGALVMLVPQLTQSINGWGGAMVDFIAAVVGGGAIIGYAKFVKWEQNRPKHNS